MVKSCSRAHESTKNTQKTLQDDTAELKSSRRSRLHESIILCEQVVLMQARAGPRHSRLHESISEFSVALRVLSNRVLKKCSPARAHFVDHKGKKPAPRNQVPDHEMRTPTTQTCEPCTYDNPAPMSRSRRSAQMGVGAQGVRS